MGHLKQLYTGASEAHWRHFVAIQHCIRHSDTAVDVRTCTAITALRCNTYCQRLLNTGCGTSGRPEPFTRSAQTSSAPLHSGGLEWGQCRVAHIEGQSPTSQSLRHCCLPTATARCARSAQPCTPAAALEGLVAPYRCRPAPWVPHPPLKYAPAEQHHAASSWAPSARIHRYRSPPVVWSTTTELGPPLSDCRYWRGTGICRRALNTLPA